MDGATRRDGERGREERRKERIEGENEDENRTFHPQMKS